MNRGYFAQEVSHNGSKTRTLKNPQNLCSCGLDGGAAVGIRTPNLLIRSQMLYPIELRLLERELETKAGCGAVVKWEIEVFLRGGFCAEGGASGLRGKEPEFTGRGQFSGKNVSHRE
jgi:hypothetical protein